MIIPLYNQSDPRWGGDKLGTCDETISSAGCLITAISMMIMGFRNNDENPINLSPHDLNDWLTANGGYTNGCYLIWDAVSRVPGNDSIYEGFAQPPIDLSAINARLDAGEVAICEVRWGGNPDLMHFVLIGGRNGDWDYDVFDPAMGDMTHFASGRYGTGSAAADIKSLHFYRDATNPTQLPVLAAAPAPVAPPQNPNSLPTEPIPAETPQIPAEPSVEAPVTPVETSSPAQDTSPKEVTNVNFDFNALPKTVKVLPWILAASIITGLSTAISPDLFSFIPVEFRVAVANILLIVLKDLLDYAKGQSA